MKNYRILVGFMVVLFIGFLSLSDVTYADSGHGEGKSGHSKPKKGKKLPKHARELQAQINANATAIENIELTPGPQGDQGPAGADGADGAYRPGRS